jgi:hypothetical protein
MWVCVCVCIYIYIYIYVCICVCIYVSTSPQHIRKIKTTLPCHFGRGDRSVVCRDVCMCVNVRMHMYVCMYVYTPQPVRYPYGRGDQSPVCRAVWVCVFTYVYMCLRPCVRTYGGILYVCLCMYTHTWIHIHERPHTISQHRICTPSVRKNIHTRTETQPKQPTHKHTHTHTNLLSRMHTQRCTHPRHIYTHMNPHNATNTQTNTHTHTHTNLLPRMHSQRRTRPQNMHNIPSNEIHGIFPRTPTQTIHNSLARVLSQHCMCPYEVRRVGCWEVTYSFCSSFA